MIAVALALALALSVRQRSFALWCVLFACDVVALCVFMVQVILAGLRVVFFLPYIWQYRNDKRMLHPTLPLLWQLANLCVIAAKTVNYIYQHESSSAQWSLVALSAVSVLCQVSIT